MAAPSLVEEVQDLSRQIADALERVPPGDLYAAVAGATSVNDFLFEIKVLFCLLNHLKTAKWQVQVENLQAQQVRLPRKPGAKQNFTFFHISHQTDGVWHLVHGTEIETRVGTTAAPDLSLQEVSAGNTPRFGKIKAIWDAKLHGQHGGPVNIRVTNDDFCRFVWVRDKLNVPRPGNGDPLSNWPPAFEVSGLISNGTLPFGPDTLFFEDGISAVQHFQGTHSPTYPTRREHIQNQSGPTI